MKIIALRHGETEDNRRGILRGRPEQGLTNVGQGQANNAALELKNEHIDEIYSSDFQRCVETVKAIRSYHADVPAKLSPELRELGKGKSKLPLWMPAYLVEPVLNLVLRLNISTPGGESWRGLKTRVRDFLNELYDLHADETVLLVTHGITIRAIEDLLSKEAEAKVQNKVIPNGYIVQLTMNSRIDS